MGLIAMFLCYDLDELISARPAAGCFKIFSAATDNEIENLKKSLSVFDKNINSLESSVDLKKFPKFYDFFKSHCNCRTYVFQIRKCSLSLSQTNEGI